MVKFLLSLTMLITWYFVFDIPATDNNNQINDKDQQSIDYKRDKRTVGGSEAPVDAFPYQISLRTQTDNHHFCSGSILSPTVILTAAHCIYRKSVTELIVVAGSNKISSGGTKHNVIIALPHEQFKQKYLTNDIALLILYPPLSYSNSIKPIILEGSYIGHNVTVTLSGWGKLRFNGPSPDVLNFLNVTTIDLATCRSKSLHKEGIITSTICTLTKIGEGACESDSGGPLVADGRQVGIVSWGKDCADGYPDIHTRVASYIPWIEEKIYIYQQFKYRC